MFERLHRMRLATKHFLFLLLGGLAVFGALTWSILVQSEQLFREQTISDSEIIMKRTNDYLHAYLENVQLVMLQLAARTDILYHSDEQTTIRALREYADANQSIVNTIFLVREDRSMLSSVQLYLDILGNEQLPDVFELAKGNYGGINWSEPYWSTLSQRTIAFVRPVNEGGRTGVLVFEINLQELSSRLATLSGNASQTFMVLSAGGRLVAGNADNKLLPYRSYPSELPPELSRALSELPIGTSELRPDADRELIAVKSNMNRLGWSLIALFDEGHFFRNIGKLYASFGRAALLLVAILVIGSLLLTRTFSYPIKVLASKMDRVHDLDMPSSIHTSRGDEIGDLARSYNSLMARISKLNKDIVEMEGQKRVYEIRMLQNQIGPHFLYNTLACIASLAQQNKTDQVQRTIHSLVGLLNIAMGKESSVTTLEEELAGIRMFAQIQNVRYPDRISLILDIEPEVLDCLMPRLTLQPLVENAIFHGIVPTRQPGFVRIRAYRSRQGVRIYIADNGTGMSRADFRRLLDSHADHARQDRSEGLGLYNVDHRLKLYFGGAYGLRAAGRRQTGTVVCIRLPYTTDRSRL